MKIYPCRKSLILFICMILNVSIYAQTSEADKCIEAIKKNYIRAVVGEDQEKKKLIDLLVDIPKEEEVSDQNVIELQQRYPITSKEVKALVGGLLPDGSWNDIDYNDTKRSGWSPKIHAERILKLAKYYYLNNRLTDTVESNEIRSAIHKALNFWFDSKLVCKNWWYNQIGIPRTLGPAFLLFEQEMSDSEKQDAIEVMKQSQFGMTGQNKVWLAGNVLIRGLLQNDWELVQKAQAAISSEIILGQQEGIKEDWSFHQHGAQQQMGNYGLSLICNMSFYLEAFAGTPLAFSKEQQQILVSYLLEGYQWIIWHGYWDVNGLNRQLFRNADVDKSYLLSFAACSLMKGCDMENSARIKDFLRRNYFEPDTLNTFTGNKFFWESDFTIHRTPQWMASLRMASVRVIGTELVNEDNLKGYYMADGALYTYTRGDEYHNIFPYWDWRRIPGITTYESNAPIPNSGRKDARNQSSYVGGATDGTCGITSMQLKRNGLTAHKAWIFTSDYVLCLGSNIQSDSTATIITSIDQRFAKGKVWKDSNKRFFHDNTGYIVLQADTCIAVAEKKQGQWHDFMGMYKPAMLENEIFSIYLKHRKDLPATYAYLILPSSTQRRTEKFDTKSIHILQNNPQAQVVIINETAYMTIYQPMNVNLGNNVKVQIASPGNYMVNTRNGEYIESKPFK